MVSGSFGEKVRHLRQQLSMSQRDLAEATSISQPTLHRIEKGAREASPLESSLIADALGVSVNDLESDDGINSAVARAGRTTDSGAEELADYLRYLIGLEQRLDELGF